MKKEHTSKTSPREPRTAPIAGERPNDPPDTETTDDETTPESPDPTEPKPAE
jgi:hypothetical protein